MTIDGTIQQYGFWALLILMLVEKLVIPIANKIIPAKVKASITHDERAILALENSNKVNAQLAELMRQQVADHAAMTKSIGEMSVLSEQSNKDHTTIITALTANSSALAVLLDRVVRQKPSRKK